MLRARLDVFIYFFIREFGWGKFEPVRNSKGNITKIQTEPSPLSGMRRLGYPGRRQLMESVLRVKRACPEECARVRKLHLQINEARRRFAATRDNHTWQWYVRGGGNSMSLCLQEKIMRERKDDRMFRTGYFKYPCAKLLPRRKERIRARGELKTLYKELYSVRESIFSKMGVPEDLRTFA